MDVNEKSAFYDKIKEARDNLRLAEKIRCNCDHEVWAANGGFCYCKRGEEVRKAKSIFQYIINNMR